MNPSLVSRQPTLLGRSQWMQRIYNEIARCAKYDVSVLIVGPTGTGKELIARAIHASSGRAAGPFIAVDCTTVGGALFSSQLFGHVRGAFTGAMSETLGCFRAASGGTIFLDEIGDLELDSQAKLLRVLQERVVVPVGGYESIPVDVRVVAATNRDLKRDTSARRFREDLYFRLNGMTLETLGLQQRPEDISSLCEYFLQSLAGRGFQQKHLSPGAVELLEAFDWPGNVRQLEHLIEQAVIVSDGTLITAQVIGMLLQKARLIKDDAPINSTSAGHDEANSCPESSPYRLAPVVSHTESQQRFKTLDEIDREHIRSALEHTYYNQSAAARLLGLSRQALIRRIKLHAIDMCRFPPGRPAL